MNHATMPLEDLERLLCREIGHKMIREESGAPVTDFRICIRCGWFTR